MARWVAFLVSGGSLGFLSCVRWLSEVARWAAFVATVVSAPKCQVYNVIEDYMAATGMCTPPIPQTWLRDSYILLRTTKSKDGITDAEQHAAIHRILGLISQTAAADEVDLRQPSQAQMVVRKITEESRKLAVATARKYVAGMTAAQKDTGYTYLTFLDEFAAGTFDNKVRNTQNPELAAKYWPWVKEAQAKEAADSAAMQERLLEEQAKAG